LEVATCLLLEALSGRELPVLDRVKLCQKAEHTFAGVPCGIMDQFVVAAAQPLGLDAQLLGAGIP
jgi:galactokinase